MAQSFDSRRRLLLGGLLPLVLGASVYLFLRPREAWFVVRLASVSVLGDAVRGVRGVTVPLARHLPSGLLGVLPDLAWAFAAGAVLAIAWRGKPGRGPMVWCVLGALAIPGYELAQRWQLVPGTFDPGDLVAQILGYAAGWLLHPGRPEVSPRSSNGSNSLMN